MSGAAVPWLEIVALLRNRCGLLDAVVFSGGEPTMQAGLPDAMRAVRGMGFKVGLHTAGPSPERFRECLPYLDWVGMDLKAPFEEYEQITGIPGSGEAARQSAELLRQSSVSHQFRTTVEPFLESNGRIESMLQLVEKWGEELKLQQIVY